MAMINEALTRQDKLERLRHVQVQITGTETDVFSADVSEAVQRYITAILMTNAGTDPTTYTINKVDEADTTTDFIDSIYVDGAGNEMIGEPGDVDRPILRLAGGENLSRVRDGTINGELTVWYYDEEEY